MALLPQADAPLQLATDEDAQLNRKMRIVKVQEDYDMLTPLFPTTSRAQFINKGGFAEIFQDPRNQELLLKKFNTPQRGEQAAMVARLISVQEWARPSDRHILLTRFSWPIEGFGTQQEIVGFSMPKAPDDSYFTLTAAGRTSRQLLQMKFLMDSDYWNRKAVTSPKPYLSEQDRIEIAIDLHDSIQTIHQHGLVYSDYSGNNLVVRQGKTPSVFILDADSIATPELREKYPIKSPTWEVPAGLDPIESDRSLFALWCWRFLIEQYAVFPREEDSSKFQALDSRSIVDALVFTYQTGNRHSFDSLSDELRRIRNDERDSLAVKRAAETGFARLVLKESLETKRTEDQQLIHSAKAQVQREKLIEDSNETRQSLLLARQSRQSSRFTLDLSPSITTSSPPRDSNDLWRMLNDARETEVAVHLANGSLSRLEKMPIIERAAQHALAEVPAPSIRSRASIGLSTFEWDWPPTPYVNLARLALRAPNGKVVTHDIERERDALVQERQVSLPRGGTVEARLCFGISSPLGTTFVSSNSTRHEIAVLAPPVSPNPQRSGRLSTGPQSLDDLHVIDPAEIQRQAIEQERLRKRKNIQRALTGVACVLVIISAGAIALLTRDSFTPRQCVNAGIIEIELCAFRSTGRISRLDLYEFSDNYPPMYHSRTWG